MKWKSIPNHPSYRISDDGKVKSIKSGRWKRMMGTTNKKGYITVELDKKRYGIHQLVLIAFVGNCPPGKYARHRNGNSSDNALTNLQWATPTDNNRDKIKHGTITKGSKVNTSKLTKKKVRKIRRLLKTTSMSKIGKRFDVSTSAVYLIKTGRNWGWLK